MRANANSTICVLQKKRAISSTTKPNDFQTIPETPTDNTRRFLDITGAMTTSVMEAHVTLLQLTR